MGEITLDMNIQEFHYISRALEKACFENNLYITGLLFVCLLSHALALELTGTNEEPSDLLHSMLYPVPTAD